MADSMENKFANGHVARGPRCSSKNSPSSNLSAAQWEFPLVKSPHSLQWDAPYLPPKLPLSVARSPYPTTCLIHGRVRPTMPNGIRMRSAVFPQCTGQTDPHTDRHRDRWLPGKFYDYKPVSYTHLTLPTKRIV